MNNITIILIYSLNIILFTFGFFVGRYTSRSNLELQNTISNRKPESFIQKNQNTSKNNAKISIDETKYVVSINTDSMEKKFNKFGETKKSSEDISQSVNKLKNMKG